MGLVGDTQKIDVGGSCSSGDKGGCFLGGMKSLVRRKQVDSANSKSSSASGSSHELAKALTIPHLITIGVGSTIGAGVYILVGTVAREHSGPALTISFLIAGIAAALSAFCYAELASRCPSAGSAYHYSYICVGEGVAWLVGWALVLEYTIGGSAVARGISPNLAMLFGSPDSLPAFLARHTIPGLNVTVDPCAAILVFLVTGLLCVGIKESAVVQGFVTSVNVCVMAFVIVAGGYLGYKAGWPGYELPVGYFPYGVDGMLAGASTVFFAFIGFDSVASTAEEVKNPQRDLPMGIGFALSICCSLYMLVSAVIVGLVPYYAMDPDTPISSAFVSHGIHWAAYIITIGAITSLCSTLMGSILPQPRILMAMARDGLLPSFFADVNKRTQVPVKATVATGLLSATLAFFMNVEQLSGMVSVGTLLAFTMVAISVLILRYVPPDEVPLPSSFQEAIDSVSLRRSGCSSSSDIDVENTKIPTVISGDSTPLLGEISVGHPLVGKAAANLSYLVRQRRKIAGWTIMFICIGVCIVTSAASIVSLSNSARYALSGIGGLLLLSGLIVLTCIDQDDARHSFGHTGGFTCPFVPLLPIACILINAYLLINLGGESQIQLEWTCTEDFYRDKMGYTKEQLLALLQELQIDFTKHEHPVVLTVEAQAKHVGHLNGALSKNLFLKDKKHRFYVVSALAKTNVDLKVLSQRLGLGKGGLRMAPEEALAEILQVPLGCVTPFALVNESARCVSLLLDQGFKTKECCFFHPLSNDTTIALNARGLDKFLSSIGKQPIYVDLEANPPVGKDQPPDLASLVPSDAIAIPGQPDKAAPSQASDMNHAPVNNKSAGASAKAVKPSTDVRKEKLSNGVSSSNSFSDPEKYVEDFLERTSSLVLSEITEENVKQYGEKLGEVISNTIRKKLATELKSTATMFKNTAYSEGFSAGTRQQAKRP